MKLFIPLPLSEPLNGAEAARQFDAQQFDEHPDLVAYVRLSVVAEFDALIYASAPVLKAPFLYLVLVQRGGGMFEIAREVVQVRAIAFDPSRPGTLRRGIVTTTPDRPAEPMSKGEASRLLYDVS